MLLATTSRHAGVGLRLRLASSSPLLVSARQLSSSSRVIAQARVARQTSRAALPASSATRSFGDASLCRTYSTNATPTETSAAQAPSTVDGEVVATYEAPLGRTFRRLKIFSLTSLSIASIGAPALLLAPGDYAIATRIVLAITGLATSGLSTALIAFLGGPYVNTMRLVALPRPAVVSAEQVDEAPRHVIELDTFSWRLQKITTTIFEPSLLRPTERPFATWEVAVTGAQIKALLAQPRVQQTRGEPLLITESRYAKSGEVRGSFVLKEEVAEGIAKVEAIGHPLRHFQVHEELLGGEWQVLE